MTSHPHQTADTPRDAADESAFVVGGAHVGRNVADKLTESCESVTFVDRSPPTDPPPCDSVSEVDTLDATALTDANFGDATTALVLEPNDAANLLVAQLARTRFDVDRVIVRVNDPECVAAFDRPGVEPVDATAALARTVTERW